MAKIVVVGANHAGTAAIKTMLTNYGQENEIVVFDQNSNISFLGCGMALWIGEQIGGPEGLFYSNKEELESLGATVYMESPVTNIDYDAKTVTALVNGQEHVESFENFFSQLVHNLSCHQSKVLKSKKVLLNLKQLLKTCNLLNCTKTQQMLLKN